MDPTWQSNARFIRMIPAILILSGVEVLSSGDSPVEELPPDAFVVETQSIPATIHPARELVLWMRHPRQHDRGVFQEGDAYSCLELTLGSFYSGPTRISLVDTDTKHLINTIEIRYPDSKEDTFDVPYRILPNYYYRVPGELTVEGKPELLHLEDYNGDGKALESAFFYAEACMGLPTTLIGYSVKQGRNSERIVMGLV